MRLNLEPKSLTLSKQSNIDRTILDKVLVFEIHVKTFVGLVPIVAPIEIIFGIADKRHVQVAAFVVAVAVVAAVVVALAAAVAVRRRRCRRRRTERSFVKILLK